MHRCPDGNLPHAGTQRERRFGRNSPGRAHPPRRADMNGPGPAWDPAHSITDRLTSASASLEASSGRTELARSVNWLDSAGLPADGRGGGPGPRGTASGPAKPGPSVAPSHWETKPLAVSSGSRATSTLPNQVLKRLGA